jgi:hypothetical protein
MGALLPLPRRQNGGVDPCFEATRYLDDWGKMLFAIIAKPLALWWRHPGPLVRLLNYTEAPDDDRRP